MILAPVIDIDIRSRRPGSPPGSAVLQVNKVQKSSDPWLGRAKRGQRIDCLPEPYWTRRNDFVAIARLHFFCHTNEHLYFNDDANPFLCIRQSYPLTK
ncbi:hypothetical protein GCK32_021153 [Trichostrongylus colubriformis]|uniref:Uncharacterized protein n=1 Tax=Trichostrongylus colubriformis TaxID=6319 RepID=A0AAN8FHS8_TRICO